MISKYIHKSAKIICVAMERNRNDIEFEGTTLLGAHISKENERICNKNICIANDDF